MYKALTLTKARLIARLLPVLLLLLGCWQQGRAQFITSYSRTVLTGQTYTQISGGTVINANSQLSPGMSQNADDGSKLVTLPFTFNYDGTNYTQVTFCTNGWVGMGDQTLSVSAAQGRAPGNLFTTTVPNRTLACWFGDMSGNFPTGSGSMVYGSVGTDIYAFEWRNATGSGFGQTTTNLINFMVKLYGPASATPGRIELLYGTQGGSLSTGRSIGIEDAIGGANHFINALNGSFTSTTTATAWPGNGNGYRFDPPPPCSGVPGVPTVSPAGPLSLCVGTLQTLTATATPIASGYTFLWESAPIGSGVFTSTGVTTNVYTFNAFASLQYRVRVTCTASGQSTNSLPVVVNVTNPPGYAVLPVSQSFESWINRCSTNDAPDTSWVLVPATGNNSWRRNDQGSSAAWGSVNSGIYNPVAIHGSYSARFHTFSASSGTRGSMYLHVNCASVTGNKELQFYGINTSGTDSLIISLSTDGGNTFSTIGSYNQMSTWTLNTLPIVSNSATTVIKFDARSDFGVTDYGLDYVRVLPPCSGMPIAGTVSNALPCPGANFNLSTVNTSQVAGLSYQWQSSASGTGGWTNVPTGTSPILTTNITSPTYFRCIVTCTNSSQSDTTAPKLISLAPFYVCYCNSSANNTADDDIGNVTIKTQPANVTLLNNGNDLPAKNNSTSVNTYTNFTSLAPAILYRDSLYRGFVSQINSTGTAYSCGIGIYIDYNHNGVFDGNELVLSKTTVFSTNPPSPNQVTDTFRVPSNAMIGITGMRVVMIESGTPAPCGTYTWGETEDYLIDVRFPPCDGPTNAGTATISDATMCVGYDIFLSDTTHEYERSGISWSWESSSNNINWSVIPGTTNRDTLTQTVTGAAWYRLRMICSITGDTTYSNVVNVSINEPWQCYCYSIALGGRLMDTTDFGAFSIGDFVMPLTNIGPHLYNPRAIYGRTDYTDVTGLELWADSTYEVNFFQTHPYGIHSDAKVTMFIDYNNNLVYDIPDERVLTMFSSPTNWYLVNDITIPHTVISDVKTGMRIIINNNMGPNVPSDEACGAYTSGETEDYVVTLRRNFPTGVGNTGLVKDLSLYPNPTEGRFTVQFTMAQPVKDLEVAVTNLTGQTVLSQSYSNPVRQFRTEMDLTAQPRGVYLVEVRADGNKTVRKLIVR